MVNTICIYSSHVFLVNVLIALLFHDFIYAVLFMTLFITSLFVHSDPSNIYKNLLDKLSIGCVVLYGAYRLYHSVQRSSGDADYIAMIITTFILTLYLYIYGYIVRDFCFHPDKTIRNVYHAFMHCVGSIGHIMIIMM